MKIRKWFKNKQNKYKNSWKKKKSFFLNKYLTCP